MKKKTRRYWLFFGTIALAYFYRKLRKLGVRVYHCAVRNVLMNFSIGTAAV